MAYAIKELRMATGLSQSKFASEYGIPVSTLRKWEQGEASPAPYVVTLLAKAIPSVNKSLRSITHTDGSRYFYDENRKMVYDKTGNGIRIREDLEGVKEQNLGLYLHDLFKSFYEIQDRFNRDCMYDKEDDIIWT